jgi:hypothetical protein
LEKCKGEKDKEKKKWSQSFKGLAVLLIFEGWVGELIVQPLPNLILFIYFL